MHGNAFHAKHELHSIILCSASRNECRVWGESAAALHPPSVTLYALCLFEFYLISQRELIIKTFFPIGDCVGVALRGNITFFISLKVLRTEDF